MNKEKLFKFCYGITPDAFSERIVMTPFLSLERFRRYCEDAVLFKGQLFSGFCGHKNGKRITVVQTGLGDRLTGDSILLLELTPVRKVLFAGTCGGLKDLKLGDFIISESAFDGEGFSRYYDKDSGIENILERGKAVKADAVFSSSLLDFTRRKLSGKNVEKGPVFTIGSLLAEKEENMRRIQEKGFSGVEMELSAVYKAAETLKVASAGLLVVSDLPLTRSLGEEFAAGEKEILRDSTEDLIRISMEFLVDMER